MLPLLQEQAHSIATIKNAMDKVKEVSSFLNPRQTLVMACDQPLFVLAKQIQRKWPEIYGEDRFVVKFGDLHIEIAVFKLHYTCMLSKWTKHFIAKQSKIRTELWYISTLYDLFAVSLIKIGTGSNIRFSYFSWISYVNFLLKYDDITIV